MKNCRILLLACLMLICLTGMSSAQDEYVSGLFNDKSGNVVEFEKSVGSVIGDYKGTDVSLPFATLQKIQVSEDTCIVTNKQGETFSISRCTVYSYSKNQICYTFFNDITKEHSEDCTYQNQLTEIRFDEKVGRLKYNTRTKAYFPQDFSFDPYTGESLVWANPED